MRSIECSCLQTALLDGPTFSVPSGVTAMTTKAPYSDDLRPALACVNNRPERTACWLERWMIHRPNGGFAMYLVNWEIRSDADFQPSITRVPELTDPRLMAAVTFTQPANDGGGFLEWLHE
jgi:hypothetical protein